MKPLLIILSIALLASLACATSTDGNYTLLQFDVVGSGESTLTDTNYIAFADVGEPTTIQRSSDANFGLGIGFYSFPFSPLITTIVEAVEEAIEYIFLTLPTEERSIIPLILIVMGIGFVLFFLFLKSNSNPKPGF